MQEWLTVIALLGLTLVCWSLNNRLYRLSQRVEGLISLEQGSDD